MSRDEHEIGKNEEEANDLSLFVAAYRAVTGERLAREERGPDPPDFICARRDGSLVGVELTKIMRDDGRSPYARLRRVFDSEDYMDPGDAVALMYAAATRKAELIRRTAPEWLPKTILVLQLMEARADEVANRMEYEDFANLGFAEVWAADWTGLGAYGDVELVGLHPPEWHGYHDSERGKPYG